MNRDQFKDETVYDRDRLERQLWQLGRTTGLDRRAVLRMFGAGLTAGAASGFVPGLAREALANHAGSTVKPTPANLFYTLGNNREMRWESMKGKDYVAQ